MADSMYINVYAFVVIIGCFPDDASVFHVFVLAAGDVFQA
jgi:hypothetical protein